MKEELYVGNWFKLPPKEQLEKPIKIKMRSRGYGRKSCKKAKKQTAKRSG